MMVLLSWQVSWKVKVNAGASPTKKSFMPHFILGSRSQPFMSGALTRVE